MSGKPRRSRTTFHPVVDFWRREVGGLTSSNFSNRFSASENMVMHLEIYRKLHEHQGHVNTVSFNPGGDVLISGSDDLRVILWDWELGKMKLGFHSGHYFNVLQAKFMPFSHDRTIVTCAADGQVRHVSILEGGKVETSLLGMHEGIVYRICIEPGSPHIFYTCGDDGLVKRFDLRTRAPTELLTCQRIELGKGHLDTIQLNAIEINPSNYNLFAVGGMDEYARLYDIRKFERDRSNGLSQAVDHFCPPHLIGTTPSGITGLAFSEQRELLVSYRDEFIYLFSPDKGLGPNPIASFPVSNSSESSVVPLVYKGHRNYDTIKDVNFFGSRSEYVVSESDCGRIFIWRRKDGQLIRVMEADKLVVICIARHPYIPVLASSGTESDIKMWTSEAAERATLPINIEQVPVSSCRRNLALARLGAIYGHDGPYRWHYL